MITKSKFILVYHGIGDTNPLMMVSEKLFKRQINYLLSRNFRFCTIDDLLYTTNNSHCVAITFDDGLNSIIKVKEFLVSINIPIGLSIIAETLSSNFTNYLSAEELKQFRCAEFYSHGLRHKDLTKISPSEVRDELVISRDLLQKNLETLVTTFVYPFGKYNTAIIREVKNVGYKRALSLLPFHINHRSDRFAIPRINVNGHMRIDKFKLLTSFWGNAYLHGAFLKRKLLNQDYLH